MKQRMKKKRYVYAVTDDATFVKVGSTQHLQQRINNLSHLSGKDLRVIAVKQGGYESERIMHGILWEQALPRVGGDWYKLNPQVLDIIAENLGSNGLDERDKPIPKLTVTGDIAIELCDYAEARLREFGYAPKFTYGRVIRAGLDFLRGQEDSALRAKHLPDAV